MCMRATYMDATTGEVLLPHAQSRHAFQCAVSLDACRTGDVLRHIPAISQPQQIAPHADRTTACITVTAGDSL